MALLVFLVGTFRQGLYEVAHALTHYFTDGHAHHSHHAGGDGSDHHHVVLDISRSALAFYEDTPPPSAEDKRTLSYDRITHVIVSVVPIPQQLRWNKKIPLFDFQLPATPLRQIPTPPPDLGAYWHVFIV